MPGMCNIPGWLRSQKKRAPNPRVSSTTVACARQNHFVAAFRVHRESCGSPPADINSTETATPDATTNKAPREACCSPWDTACQETSKNVRLRNKTRKIRGRLDRPYCAVLQECATAQRSPEITPVRRATGTPATGATLPSVAGKKMPSRQETQAQSALSSARPEPGTHIPHTTARAVGQARERSERNIAMR